MKATFQRDKATFQRSKLLHAFQLAASVAPMRSSRSILQNVKLDVTKNGAVLMASDGDIGIRIEVDGLSVEAPGSVVLPRDWFGRVLSESPDEKLSLETKGGRVFVRGQQGGLQLPVEKSSDFPDVLAFKEKKYHEMPACFFREVIRRTAYATENESRRYALDGVLVEITTHGLTAVATDGRRLARQVGPATSVGGHVTGDATTIIPTKAMNLLERALADNEGNIQLAVRKNDILVKSGRATVYARLVKGRYPEWRDLFPRREGMRIDLTVGPFYAAVRQAAIAAGEEYCGVNFTFGDGKIILAAHGEEYGESHVEMPIAYYGADVGIALNSRFLGDFLRVLDAEQTFTMELFDAESAAVCSTEDGYAYVVMPLERKQ